MRVEPSLFHPSRFFAACLIGAGFLLSPALFDLTASHALAQGKDPATAIKKFDKNGDGRVSRKEWKRDPDTFGEIDTDGDGFLTLEEFKARFGGGEKSAKKRLDMANRP